PAHPPLSLHDALPILLPWQMDGVPGVSFPGIAPRATFEYRFPLKQAGTYWYHSHSGFQEQIGHYGPIIIDPREPAPYGYEREYRSEEHTSEFQSRENL